MDNILSMYYCNVDNDFISVNDLYLYLYDASKVTNHLCFYFLLIKVIRVIYVFHK